MESEAGPEGAGETALDTFREANHRFRQELEEVKGEPAEEVEVVDRFLSSVAEVDPRESLKRQTINIVSEQVSWMTKSSTERQLNEEIRSSGEPDDRPDIRELLTSDRIDRIEKLVTDESESENRYRFVFQGGDSMVIDSETLYSPTKFRRAYNGVYDVLPRFPGEVEDWENLLAALQEEHLIVKSDSVGPRSQAVTKLRSKVESSEAYIDRDEAMRKGQGILIDVGSMEEVEEADEVWVAYDEISKICDDVDISPEALRIELDDRDLRTGSSEQKRFDGRRATFWPLKKGPEGFEPKLIEPPEESKPNESGP